jgi:hypothetical protein
MKGWVYIARNESLLGTLKVGFTERDPALRMTELSNTSLPTPFECVYVCLCENAERVEQNLHVQLAHYRHSASREFFKCDAKLIVASLKEVLEELSIDTLFEEWKVDDIVTKCSETDVRKAHDRLFQTKIDELRSLIKKARKVRNDIVIDQLVDFDVNLLTLKKEGLQNARFKKVLSRLSGYEWESNEELATYLDDLMLVEFNQVAPWFDNLPAVDDITEETEHHEVKETFRICSICNHFGDAQHFMKSKNGKGWYVCPKCGCTFRYYS